MFVYTTLFKVALIIGLIFILFLSKGIFYLSLHEALLKKLHYCCGVYLMETYIYICDHMYNNSYKSNKEYTIKYRFEIKVHLVFYLYN